MQRINGMNITGFIRQYHLQHVILILVVVATGFWFCLPQPLFSDPLSTVVYDRNGEPAGAHIADDGQWRFPFPDSLPQKFNLSILHFEDEYFYMHPGFNPFSLAHALIRNIKTGRIVSGGSTISMQVIRLSRKGKSRTIVEKVIEIVLSMRLEFQYSKDEILKLYAANAPFGGNVVGLEAASWRYFGRQPSSLSWAESATLAVLPNAPSLVHPGRNKAQLKKKRNRLLKKLFDHHIIDETTYQLSMAEPLPDHPRDLPTGAYHLCEHFYLAEKGKRITSTVDMNLQEKINGILETHRERLYSNQIHNAACLVLKVETGEVLAYAGNIRNENHPEYGGDVDVIMSPRSTGSILKPFLYAEMLYRGEILPGTLIADIPTRFRGYNPKNYDRGYDGAVPASLALARSLNVPAVRMLYQYGTERFHHDLRELGFTSVKFSPEHYGLSLILGGAEVSLWELAGVYATMARVLSNFTLSEGSYFDSDWHMPVLTKFNASSSLRDQKDLGFEQGRLGAGPVWLTLQALREVNRPQTESGWQFFTSSRKVAWKTGTSFGFRDGWAVGITPEYVVAVWTGNADGEGRPGLTGINTAAPLLFDIFHVLPETGWFDIPYDDLVKAEVCHESGYRPSRDCTEKDSVWLPVAGLHSHPCPYHRMVHLSDDGNYRATASCSDMNTMVHKSWFVLPPSMEWYFRKSHPGYRVLPPMKPGCTDGEDITQIEILYPDRGSVIYIPLQLDGSRGKVIFEAAHRHPEKTIFWSIDDEFISKTVNFHQIEARPAEGHHILMLVDEDGNSVAIPFEVLEK